mmetsp:Transcript_65810/g.148477  ORF Transcript_65810/g.148477 Transcript_65810/m.148477 type:complete len:398 (+) Transcript_65810:231-1424(+)
MKIPKKTRARSMGGLIVQTARIVSTGLTVRPAASTRGQALGLASLEHKRAESLEHGRAESLEHERVTGFVVEGPRVIAPAAHAFLVQVERGARGRQTGVGTQVLVLEQLVEDAPHDLDLVLHVVDRCAARLGHTLEHEAKAGHQNHAKGHEAPGPEGLLHEREADADEEVAEPVDLAGEALGARHVLGLEHLRHDEPWDGAQPEFEEADEGHDGGEGDEVGQNVQEGGHHQGRAHDHPPRAHRHESAPAYLVHQKGRRQRRDHVDGADQGGPEEGVIDHAAEEIRRIVEHRVDSAKLLRHVEDDGDHDERPDGGVGKHERQRRVALLLRRSGPAPRRLPRPGRRRRGVAGPAVRPFRLAALERHGPFGQQRSALSLQCRALRRVKPIAVAVGRGRRG